jgi:hypothetical protein
MLPLTLRPFRLILGLGILLCPVSPARAQEAHWPANINVVGGFRLLGEALRSDPGFPASGSDVEKARYVGSRLPEIATRYGLYPGSGSLLDQVLVGVSRGLALFYDDRDNTSMLNGLLGKGNCAEWSYALNEMLLGAGLPDTVVCYGDSSPNPGYSLGFTGTDTMLVVFERAEGRYSRRVFDAFRAAYHGPNRRPDAASAAEWMDLPLAPCDRWRDEAGKPSWLEKVGKGYVKEASAQTVLSEPTTPRITPSVIDRPRGKTPTGKGWQLARKQEFPASPPNTGPTWDKTVTKSPTVVTYREWSSTDAGVTTTDLNFSLRLDAPPASFGPGDRFTLSISGSASVGPHIPGYGALFYGSYETVGLRLDSGEPCSVGLRPGGEIVNSCSRSYTFTVPADAPSEVIIRSTSSEGIVVEYVYTRP